ncbi:TadE/TadG family type IV pilus assembly protein [Vibrio sp. TBV020]|uniref:TadE/TadG family type IV pilus assembly protein n=1 Tax=Vibrio sp. TBV020 TaxID=3137398 RepID=UPI0038CDA982
MRKQAGITIIEFTLVSSFLMMIILAIASIGYFIFSMQSVSESVRAAARMASVCQLNDSDIKTFISNTSYISSLAVENIEIEYLDGSSNVLATPDSEDVRFVRARATGMDYRFVSILSFLGDSGVIAMPSFETTIPSESLGLVPNDTNTDC